MAHDLKEQTKLVERLSATKTESGRSLLELVDESPVLLVFLRHFGCSYCRQAISDIAEVQGDLEGRGVRPVFVHLGTPDRAEPQFAYYGLPAVERISDPEARLYTSDEFRLPRVHPALHFLEGKVWRGWIFGGIWKYGIGWLREDSYQMPGVFFLKDRSISNAFRHKTIADQPNYLGLIG